jgi:hypothetical protein
MKLVMTLLVRNEEDILDWNLHYHFEQGVAFVIATDNNSTDATPDILRHYEREGRLRFIRERADDYSQGVWVTRMARMAALEYGADWVINNDADEFWWPRQGDLCSTLAPVPAGTVALHCERLNFVPVKASVDGPQTFWERMIWRQAQATNALGGKLPGKVCHRGDPQIRVAQGNHVVDGLEGLVQGTDCIEILHYPMRSFAQLETKIRLGGAAYERNKNLHPSVGGTWRHLYALHGKGGLRSWYDTQVNWGSAAPDEDTHGELFLRDTRLRDYFVSVGKGRHEPADPTGAAFPPRSAGEP